MNEFESCQKEVCSIMPYFLNRTQNGENAVNDFISQLCQQFSLTQEQRCAVKIALAHLSMLQIRYGEVQDEFVAVAINLITYILINDWDGVEEILNDTPASSSIN